MNKNAKKTNENENEKQQKPLWKRALKGFGIFYGSVIAFIAILSILAMIFSPMLASAMELEEEYRCEYCGDTFSSQKKWEKHVIKCDVLIPPVEESTTEEPTTVPDESITEEVTTEPVVETTTNLVIEETTEQKETTTVAETTTVPEKTTIEVTTKAEEVIVETTTQETTTKPVETTTETVVEVTTFKPAVDEVTTRPSQPNINFPEINWEGIVEFFTPDKEEIEEVQPEEITEYESDEYFAGEILDDETTEAVVGMPLEETPDEYLGEISEDSYFPETGNPAPIVAFLLLGIATVGIVVTKKKHDSTENA